MCNDVQTGCDINDDFCLSRYSVMRKTATKKMEFEYGCFPCLKQDEKARCYTRSYDLILHMVNTHRKFPTGAKHNAYYAADGTDLRDATREEIEKYRLAAMHKRKKPDADPTWGKGGNSASTTRGSKDRKHQRDDIQRKSDSSRDREADRGAQGREADVRSSRPSSRNTQRERRGIDGTA